MKEGFIKIEGYDNLYYDSITKQYKSKMHCPYCGKPVTCWCYPDFESVPLFEEELPKIYCSNKCLVLDSDYNVKELAHEMRITIKPTMEEWNALKIVKVLMEDNNYDFDLPSGSVCEL